MKDKRNTDLIKKLEKDYDDNQMVYCDLFDQIDICKRHQPGDFNMTGDEWKKELNRLINLQNDCKKEMDRLGNMIKILKKNS